MKTKLLWAFALLFAFYSCQDDQSQDLEPTKDNKSLLAKTRLQKLPLIFSSKGSNTKSSSQSINHHIDLSNPPRSVMINGRYDSNFRYWFEDGASSHVPTESGKDILSKDGWEVFYNTIQKYNPSTQKGTTTWPLVGLYNRYRGILRFFYYHPTGTEGNDMVATLGYDVKNSSKIFNHAVIGESYPIDRGQINVGTRGSALNSDLVNTSVGLAINNWYCFEFDVSCYEANIPSNILKFRINSVTRSQFKQTGSLNGKIVGTIVGGVPSGGSLLDIGSLVTKNNTVNNTTNVNMEINANNADAVGTILSENANSSTAGIDVKNLFKDVVKDGVKALKKGISSFMTSGVSGLFSSLSASLFGKPQQEIKHVKLSANFELKTNGTITTLKTPVNINIEIPTSRLGLLHLTTAPVVHCKESIEINPGLWNSDTQDPNSYMCVHYFNNINYNVVLNKSLENEVDIYTSSDLLYIEKSPVINLTSTPGSDDNKIDFTWGRQKTPYRNAKIVGLDANTEIWNTAIIPLPHKDIDKTAYKDFRYGNKRFITSKPLNNVYVKLNFKIVPRNGSKPYYLQKTYKAKVIENNTRNPFPPNWDNINDGPGQGPGDPGY